MLRLIRSIIFPVVWILVGVSLVFGAATLIETVKGCV